MKIRRPGEGQYSQASSTVYVMHVQTSAEYRQKRGALAHTDGRGKDVAVPEKVRIYVIEARHTGLLWSGALEVQFPEPTNPRFSW
jgi:hypothetical protein